MVSLPYAIIVVVITWLLSGGITYGVLKTKIDNMQLRLDHHDEEILEIKRAFIPRNEHEIGRTDIIARLARIERKIDQVPGVRGD